MNQDRIFLGSELPPQTVDNRDKAFWHILPYGDSSHMSWKGSCEDAPARIIEASSELEPFNYNYNNNPMSLGIHTFAENSLTYTPSEYSVSKGSFPIVIGGDHSVTYTHFKDLYEHFDGNLGIVQIDAHADLRDVYQNDYHSHACVMRRIHELGAKIHQVGTRAVSEEEKDYRINNRKDITWQDAIHVNSIPNWSLNFPPDFPSNVFLTIDIDGFDPTVFPSTGTPVPGGLTWLTVHKIIDTLSRRRKVIGFDVVEFSPIPNFHCYDFMAAQLIYNVMSIVMNSQQLSRKEL